MTPEQTIKDMLTNGQLININDKVTLQIFDAKILDKDTAVFQMIGCSNDLDAYVTMNYCANMSDARRFGEYLIDLANKYDSQTVEGVQAEVKTKKAKK